MDKRAAELIVRAGQELGFQCEIYEDYSGRFMYGEKTTGMTFDSINEVIAAAFEAGKLAQCEDLDITPGNLRHDSMGLGIIVY